MKSVKYLFALFLFGMCSLRAFGASFIDNPAFRHHWKGWITHAGESLLCKGADRIYYGQESDEYNESELIYAACQSDPEQWSWVEYKFGAPMKTSLHYAVEVSSAFEREEAIEVLVELLTIEEEVVNSKRVFISNHRMWHRIESDYPSRIPWAAAKLRIATRMKDKRFFEVSYAQVGTNKNELGGRGQRWKYLHEQPGYRG